MAGPRSITKVQFKSGSIIFPFFMFYSYLLLNLEVDPPMVIYGLEFFPILGWLYLSFSSYNFSFCLISLVRHSMNLIRIGIWINFLAGVVIAAWAAFWIVLQYLHYGEPMKILAAKLISAPAWLATPFLGFGWKLSSRSIKKFWLGPGSLMTVTIVLYIVG